MQCTAFERSILDWYLARYEDEGLAAQIRAAVATQRAWTGAGFFLDLAVPAKAPPAGSGIGSHLEGPFVESPALEYGAGVILVSKYYRLLFLEVFAYGGHFPEELSEYRLLDETR